MSIHLKESIESGSSTSFVKSKQNINSRIFASLQRSWLDKIIISSKLGIEHGRSTLSPVLVHITGSYLLSPSQKIRASVRSLYRLPTFNELYWEPGGNPNLNPENGHSMTLDYFLYATSLKFALSASVVRLNNRILWEPQASGLFRPINIGKIGSEELTAGFTWNKKLSQADFSSGVRYVYLVPRIRSQSSSSIEGNDLPFSPRHSLSIHARILIKQRLSIQLKGKYQSKSYTSSINDQSIDAFYILQSDVRYTFLIGRQALSSYIKINNITDSNYFLSNGYPQPPRHIQVGFLLKLKSKR